jgi:hypothetical protein
MSSKSTKDLEAPANAGVNPQALWPNLADPGMVAMTHQWKNI